MVTYSHFPIQDMKECFTGCCLWEKIEDFKKAQKKEQQQWKIFALYKHEELFLIPKDSWVLYRVRNLNIF